MTRRSFLILATGLSAAILLAACGGSSGTTAPTVAGAVPTAAVANTSAPLETLAPGATPAVPSIMPDNELAAKFPKSIDGQPVGQIQTGLFASTLQGFNIPDATLAQVAQSFNAIGVDFTTLSSGIAHYTVDGADVSVGGIRTPGSDANKLLAGYATIISSVDAIFGTSPPPPPQMVQGNVGGKNVTLATDADGKVTTLYVSGDTVFSTSNLTDSQTAKIMAALP